MKFNGYKASFMLLFCTFLFDLFVGNTNLATILMLATAIFYGFELKN